jgi:hypothetical protein
MTVTVSTVLSLELSAARDGAPARTSGSKASHVADDLSDDLKGDKGSLRELTFYFLNM